MKSISVVQKKRGRPSTGQDPVTAIRLSPDLRDRLDAWISRQEDPKPSRSEAIRRFVESALAAEAPALSVAEQIERQTRKIVGNPVPEKPSPAKGIAMLRSGKAKVALLALSGRKGGKNKSK